MPSSLRDSGSVLSCLHFPCPFVLSLFYYNICTVGYEHGGSSCPADQLTSCFRRDSMNSQPCFWVMRLKRVVDYVVEWHFGIYKEKGACQILGMEKGEWELTGIQPCVRPVGINKLGVDVIPWWDLVICETSLVFPWGKSCRLWSTATSTPLSFLYRLCRT